MNATLEQLLAVRSSRDLCSRGLDLNMELVTHLNKVQTAEAIRQVKVHGATTAYALQQVHKESVLALECQVMEEERCACQAFMEAFRVAMGSYLPENWGALLYPIQVLTSNMPLAALLGLLDNAQLWVMVDGELASTAPIPRVQEMPAPPTGTQCWHHSLDQDVLALRQEEEETVEPDYTPKEHPCQKQKEGRPVAKALKEPHCEAFSKESAVMGMAR